VELLRRQLGLTRTVAGWLVRRGFVDVERTRRFLQPRLADLSAPDAMLDRNTVARRLAQAVRARERIAVFGDYDCDGITSAAILTEVLRRLGADAQPLIASRFDGGYGVSSAAAQRILSTGARLLVTCDCGSSDHESLAFIAQQGLEVIVIDHHLVPERPLPALGFLNPHRPGCGFPYKGLASCGLALSVAAALRKELGVELDLRYWLDLVAVGTVADVAPLDGDNRALVRAGLGVISNAQRPGMQALLEIAKLGREVPLTGRDIAFRIAPQLNAPGRLGSADLALELLLAEDLPSARGLAARLDLLSSERRAQSEQILEQALEDVARHDLAQHAALVVGRRGWNPGVVGIVAGRLADRFERPVIVVGFDGQTGRGSVRGPVGSRLYDALYDAREVMVRFGGHQQAAGVEVLEERLDELRELFVAAVQRQGPRQPVDAAADDVMLEPGDDPLAVLADLDRLEPCGQGNPRPKLRARGRVCEAREVKNGHLKLLVELEGRRWLACFGPRLGQHAAALRGEVQVVGDLRHNAYPGGDPVELFVEQLLHAGAPLAATASAAGQNAVTSAPAVAHGVAREVSAAPGAPSPPAAQSAVLSTGQL
jgi:single-stranded-DNA-specific exonuclease